MHDHHEHHHHSPERRRGGDRRRSDLLREEGSRRAHRDDGPPYGRGRGGPRRGGRPEGFRGHEGHGGSFLGRRSRAGRGDIRVAVLTLVAEQPMHGYQIIRELSERSGGVWSPSPGSVYPMLQLLEDEGLVVGSDEGGKRVYAATEAGRAVLAERGTDQPAPWEQVGSGVDAALMDLRSLAVAVMLASRQLAQTGTRADVEKAKRVLVDARRALYRILADSDGTGDEEATAG